MAAVQLKAGVLVSGAAWYGRRRRVELKPKPQACADREREPAAGGREPPPEVEQA